MKLLFQAYLIPIMIDIASIFGPPMKSMGWIGEKLFEGNISLNW